MEKDAKIYVAGSQTLMGAALRRQLQRLGYSNVAGVRDAGLHTEDAAQIEAFFRQTRPEYVFLAGAKSGGILANQKFPAELMLSNLLTECHIVSCAQRHGVKKLLYLASSCVYPKLCPQPMSVASLLTGPLESTNEAYSIAKIAGIKLCESFRRQHGSNFISGILADPFGPDDEFDLENSHVIPALIRKMHEARESSLEEVEVWGSGRPRREFSFADDLADACIFVMSRYDGVEPINIGVGSDVSIREAAELIRQVVDYRGKLRFDESKPDGMPAKLLDTTPLREMGWRPKTDLRAAMAATYDGYLKAKKGKETLNDRALLQNL